MGKSRAPSPMQLRAQRIVDEPAAPVVVSVVPAARSKALPTRMARMIEGYQQVAKMFCEGLGRPEWLPEGCTIDQKLLIRRLQLHLAALDTGFIGTRRNEEVQPVPTERIERLERFREAAQRVAKELSVPDGREDKRGPGDGQLLPLLDDAGPGYYSTDVAPHLVKRLLDVAERARVAL